MHKYCRNLLIILTLASGVALVSQHEMVLAQGIGMGQGIHDFRPSGVGPPAVPLYVLLHTASGKITLHSGGSTLCHAC